MKMPTFVKPFFTRFQSSRVHSSSMEVKSRFLRRRKMRSIRPFTVSSLPIKYRVGGIGHEDYLLLGWFWVMFTVTGVEPLLNFLAGKQKERGLNSHALGNSRPSSWKVRSVR